MRSRSRNSSVLLLVVAALASAQPAEPPQLEIRLPAEVNSEKLFVMYAFAGQNSAAWVKTRPGVSSYSINTTLEGRPAARIRALLYAPGCAIQTLDLPLPGSASQRCSFTCRPLGTIPITGAIEHSERLYGRDVEIQVKYIARWAQTFLGLEDGMVPAIPVGTETVLSPDGRFRLSVPDFSRDPLASAQDHPGEFQIWARERAGGRLIAQFVPTGPQPNKTRMGGLRIEPTYPPEATFAACFSLAAPARDAEGFAIRPDVPDPCDR